MLLIKKMKNFLLMITTSLFPAFSFSLESEKGGCDDKFYETDKVFGEIQVITVCNTSDQDLVVESLASDEENFLRYTNILPNQKMVRLSTTPPSKDSKSFFNQFIFYGKNDEKDKLVVRVEVDGYKLKERSFYTEGSLEVTSSYTRNDNNLVVHLNRVY